MADGVTTDADAADRERPVAPRRPQTYITVALPVYNEARILEELHALIVAACEQETNDYEVLYVDDGSTDETAAVLSSLADRDPHVSVVSLSRNFGHPAALAAAVDLAAGQRLILMDADLQDDPAAIPKLLRLHREGADIVYVVRADRKEGVVMRSLFSLFHRLLSRSAPFVVPAGAGSFGLLGPTALTEVRRLTERLRYFPGLRAFVGFSQVPLVVERGERYDRSSRVGFRGLVRLGGLALFAQSRIPVNILYGLTAFSLLVATGLIGYAIVAKLVGAAIASWASIITAVAFFSAIVILGQTLIAEYLARIYEEVRRRPVYIVKSVRSSVYAGAGQPPEHQ